MNDIYIMLVRAYTGIGAVARTVTGAEFSHVVVSLDRKMTDFVSFSRRRHYLPFDAGFMREKRDFFAFGHHERFFGKVFKLSVSDESYKKILEFIDYCEHDEELEFDLFSMMTMPILHGLKIPKTYNCMSFTAKILELSGYELQRPVYKYSIEDIDELLKEHFYFKGWFPRINSTGYKRYMAKCSVSEYVGCGYRLFRELTVRLVKQEVKNERK